LHAKIGQDLGVFLLYRQQVVACGAVVGDRLTVGAGVRTVVAAEASREIVVAEVVRMDFPSHLHFREDIAQINVGNGIGRLHPHIGDDHVDFLTLEVLQSLRRGWSFAHLVPGVVQVFRA
jgi:hypothetical protein